MSEPVAGGLLPVRLRTVKARPSSSSRLVRHDGLVLANTVRATFASWHDRLIAAAMLLIGLAAIRSWLLLQSWATVRWAALAGGAAGGAAAARLIEARLRYHAMDGILPAEALRPGAGRRFAIAWHGVGLGALTAILMAGRPAAAIVAAPAYVAGALAIHVAARFALPQLGSGVRLGWAIRRWLRQPRVGAAAALMLTLWMLPLRVASPEVRLTVVGAGSILFALALTSVDASEVRFMAVAGHGAGRLVAHHLRGIAAFALLAVAGCGLVGRSPAAGLVAAVAAALALLLVFRVLAYRLHDRRFADPLVSVLVGLLLLSAYAAPFATPVVAVAALWRLTRRGAARTWLLA